MNIIIDDDEIDLLIAQRVFKRLPFQEDIRFFSKSEEAFEFVKSLPCHAKFRIFLDINMPVINGWEFLARLEDIYHDQWNAPEVIMLSSSTNPIDFDKAFRYSCVVDYFVKPIKARHIVDMLLSGYRFYSRVD